MNRSMIVSEQLSLNNKLVKPKDTILFGQSGEIDSLGLVTLIVMTEEKIEDEFDKSIGQIILKKQKRG